MWEGVWSEQARDWSYITRDLGDNSLSRQDMNKGLMGDWAGGWEVQRR